MRRGLSEHAMISGMSNMLIHKAMCTWYQRKTGRVANLTKHILILKPLNVLQETVASESLKFVEQPSLNTHCSY